MIAFGNPFIEVLIDANLTLNQYFVLYCHVYEKEDLIKMLKIDSEEYHKLISLGYIANFKSKDPTRRGIRFIKELVDSFADAKADNIFLAEEDLVDLSENPYKEEFDLFYKTYPQFATRPNGKRASLKEGRKESKGLYVNIVQTRRISCNELQNTIEYYVTQKEARGDMQYIKTLKNFLKEDIWKEYYDEMKTGNNNNKKNVNYGGRLI